MKISFRHLLDTMYVFGEPFELLQKKLEMGKKKKNNFAKRL